MLPPGGTLGAHAAPYSPSFSSLSSIRSFSSDEVAYQPIRNVSQVPRRVLSRPDCENRVDYAGVDDAGQTFAAARRAANHREPIEGHIGNDVVHWVWALGKPLDHRRAEAHLGEDRQTGL